MPQTHTLNTTRPAWCSQSCVWEEMPTRSLPSLRIRVQGCLGGLNVSRHRNHHNHPGTGFRGIKPCEMSPRAQQDTASLCMIRHSVIRPSAAQLNPLWLQEHSTWHDYNINREQLCFPAPFPPGRGLKHFKLPHGSLFPVSWWLWVQHPLTCICTPKFH